MPDSQRLTRKKQWHYIVLVNHEEGKPVKKRNMIKSATSITLLAALALTGCSATSTSNTSAASAISTSASSSSGTKSKSADSLSTDVKNGAKLAEDTHYSAKDVTWDSSSEVTIDLSNLTSTSGYVKLTNLSNVSNGTTIQVADSSGTVVANYKVVNSNTSLILVSSSKITKGESYTVYTTTDSVNASSTSVASNATSLGSFTAS